MDKILYINQTEREGNDSWLRYKITVGYEWEDLVMELKENHNGWAGEHRENRSFLFKDFSQEELIKKINQYVEEFSDSEEHKNRTLSQIQEALKDKTDFNIDLFKDFEHDSKVYTGTFCPRCNSSNLKEIDTHCKTCNERL